MTIQTLWRVAQVYLFGVAACATLVFIASLVAWENYFVIPEVARGVLGVGALPLLFMFVLVAIDEWFY